jgi:polyisoprenoid-binding protein YceI
MTMKLYLVNVGFLLLFVANSLFAIEFNQVQAEKSTLTFAYQQMGVSMEGKFRKLSAKVTFDPAKLGSALAQIEIKPADIDTGLADADTEALGKKWFNASAYPSAKFVSNSVKSLGGNRFQALGKLTIKGKSQDISTDFTFRQEGKNGIFDGGFTLQRLDYAIGEGEWADVSAVANPVKITFHLVVTSGK